jgi:glutamate N-acetyltransferase/amino-acid N-acetyltransferase
MIQEVPGGITAAAGFSAAGVHCGIKKSKKDLALVVSETLATAAGIFTQNKVVAAPVVLDREHLAMQPLARAIAVNSGNANACTGDQGLRDARAMAQKAARLVGARETEVLVSSTGVIGQHLPIAKVLSGIELAFAHVSRSGHKDAAEGIMTTDTFLKEAAVSFSLDGSAVTVGGMAKGSGMIAPNMATMLAFVTSDVRIAPGVLQDVLRQTAHVSFNRITVDGDTSTNDMVLVLANGVAGNAEIRGPGDAGYREFASALETVMVKLSKMIVSDGEGATKFVEIRVTGARTEADADRAARAVANSSLVKTAIHGEDANWGRILAAVGYSGIDFDPAEVSIDFGKVPILRRHYGIAFSEEEAKRVLQQKEIVVTIDLHQGTAGAVFWTCDLSKDYVAINANYRT